MRKLRAFARILTGIMAILICFGAVPANTIKAADGSLSVAVSTADAIVGDTVNVSVTLEYSKGISTAQFSLNYDTQYFDFVSGDVDGSSYAGSIPIIYMPADYPTSATWNFTFMAKTTGNTSFSTAGDTFIDPDVNPFNPSKGSVAVNIWAQGSDDATLSSLQVVNHGLAPDFAPGTTEYKSYVGTDVASVSISAIATQAAAGARTEISGPVDSLQYGKNTITITCYAPNGASIVYTVEVIRAEPEPETDPPTAPPATEPATAEPETEPETETETEPEVLTTTVITIDGNKYTLNLVFPEEEIPGGYDLTTLKIDGTDISSVTSSVTGLNLVYFTDEEGNGRIFIYDKDSKSFEEYITFQTGDNTYVYLDMSHADGTISDATEGECEIQKKKVKVYVDDADSNFVYFYAVNGKGERLWYCYDVLEQTIQRKNTIPTGGADNTEELENLSKELYSMKDSYEKVSDDNNELLKIRNITFVAGGVTIIALIIVIVVMANHKSEKKHSINLPLDVEDDLDENDENIEDDSDEMISESVEPELAVTDEETEEIQPEEIQPEEIQPEEEPATVENEENPEEDVIDYTSVTKEDMDAFAIEAEALAHEIAMQDDGITAHIDDETEPEIIDISLDIFDDEPEVKSENGPKEHKEETKLSEEPETIELEPVDNEDEDFFL